MMKKPIYKKLTIKDLNDAERPREKMLKIGATNLTDVELIAILISSGNKEDNAIELARKILLKVNFDLNRLAKMNVQELKKFKGIGTAKAVSIVAAMELSRRINNAKSNKIKINSSNEVFNYFYPKLNNLKQEEFWILMLNRSNKIIDEAKISLGGISSTVVDVKIILKTALDNLASSIIAVHNHPSGNKNPSKADINLTEKLKEACSAVDINFLDHIIIANKTYYSFADEGKI